jgi:hypothetical protein
LMSAALAKFAEGYQASISSSATQFKVLRAARDVAF